MNDGARRALAGFYASQRHKGLIGRACRVGATQRAIEQGLVQRFVERLPALLIDAIDKQIRVKRRFADHGQQLAIARVHGNGHATAGAIQLFHHFLQLDIDGHHQTIARCGRPAAQLAHGMAACRGFHLLPAGLPVQLDLVAFFRTQLANHFRATIVGCVFRVFDIFFFALVDTPYIAHDVAGRLLQRIGAKQPGLDVHARKTIALGRKLGHFFIGQARANRNRFKAFGVINQSLKLAPVACRDLHHLGQGINSFFQVATGA